MISISLCMIVKNESEVLERCLNCVKHIVDEIVIVDTGSTDNTKSIAKKYTDSIYDFVWEDDFSKARNFSFSKATKDYIMWLDADDILLEEDQKKLIQLKSTLNKDTSVVMMKYNVAFDEEGNPTYSFYRERLVLNSMNFQWIGAVHEVIEPKGNIMYSTIAICHRKLKKSDTNRNLRILEKCLQENGKLDTRQQFYYGRELMYQGMYERAITALETFIQLEDGWIENRIDACKDMGFCYGKLGMKEEQLSILFYSFHFDVPRGEVCCDIGQCFLENNQYMQAIYWYKQALNITPNTTSGGFYHLDCYSFIPYIQLCVCYDKLQNIEEAYKYHNMAKECKPNHPSVLYNEKYFQSCL